MPFEASTPVHRLFWAALPDPETSDRIARVVSGARARYGLTGRVVPANRLHVTLYHVGDDIVPPAAAQIGDVVGRARNVLMPTFTVTFDRIRSFGNGALVLSGDGGVMGLDVLHQRLSDELDWQPRPARPFVPHMKLLHDRQRIGEQHVEPTAWTIREIVLVESLLGQAVHRHLARVALH